MIVWDHTSTPPAAAEQMVLWQGGDHPSAESVPRYLEAHADRLRKRYLRFIHDVGEYSIAGKRVVEHLADGDADGFSYWWMTLLAEKSPFKSPRIYSCLKLLALEEILRTGRPGNLTLWSADRPLATALDRLCGNLGIRFSWRSVRPAKPDRSWRVAYRMLPATLQGLLSFRHLALRWPLRATPEAKWHAGEDAVFVCTYFFNLDPAQAARGEFAPRQWEGFPALLQALGKKSNWLHHYLRMPGMPGMAAALKTLRLFNRDAARQGHHAFLESALSAGIAWRTLKRWARLARASRRLRHIDRAFTPRDSAAWLWPFLRNDWATSTRGQVAVANALWVELFDTALQKIPHQNLGLYIWENQGWEAALLRAWRRHGHGKLIGVPHATTVYWHLNNFDDPLSLATGRPCAKPQPDRLAVNGPMARKAFIDTGYPPGKLAAVEALRFQYLGDIARHTDRPDRAMLEKILILGDYSRKQTLQMLACAADAARLANKNYSFTLKPHPVCPITKEDFPSLAYNLTGLPLAEIMPGFDAAFSSNTSSAGLDALLAGLPVVVFLDDSDFNHSPLRGVAGARFARNGDEMVAALNYGGSLEPHQTPENFFWLTAGLPRWKQLILLSSGHQCAAD